MVAKFRAIKPNPVNNEAMSKVLRDAAKDFSKDVVKDHDEVTQNWTSDRPKWQVRYWANQYQIGFQVYTDEGSEGAQKWIWIDLGTSGPYPIPKTGTANLAFPSIYKAGSSPGSLKTRKATSGGEMVFAKKVMHPGIKARGWSKMLQEKEQPKFEKEMVPYMAKVAKASGHSME